MTSSRNFRVVVRNVDMPEEQERDVVEIAAQVSAYYDLSYLIASLF